MGLGFKDFVAGDVLTAAQVDGYLMRQTVMVFASTAARDTALSGNLEEGMQAWTNDDNRLWAYTGAAWAVVTEPIQSWTGSVTQGSPVTGTVAASYSKRSYGVWQAQFYWGATGAGVSANDITLSLPFTLTDVNMIGGIAHFYDDSSAVSTVLAVVPGTTTTAKFDPGGGVSGALFGQSITIASGDALRVTMFGTY